jgi:hypothetical protein
MFWKGSTTIDGLSERGNAGVSAVVNDTAPVAILDALTGRRDVSSAPPADRIDFDHQG